MTATLKSRPRALARRGMSLVTSCSWRFLVPVDTTTRRRTVAQVRLAPVADDAACAAFDPPWAPAAAASGQAECKQDARSY